MEYDITSIVANVLIGFGLAIGLLTLYAWWIIRRFHNDLRTLVRDTLKEVESQLMAVTVEEDAGQLYCYREEDKQFICQGATLTEVRKKFNDLYPEKIAYLAGGDPELVSRLKDELAVIKEKENNENSVSV